MSSDSPSAKKQKTEESDELIDKAVQRVASRLQVDDKEIEELAKRADVLTIAEAWKGPWKNHSAEEAAVEAVAALLNLTAQNKGLTAENKGLTAENKGLKELMFGHHIKSDGLELLCDETISTAHLLTNHEASELVVEDCIKWIEIDWAEVGERTIFQHDDNYEISSEGDVQTRVHNLVRAVMVSLRLEKVLAVYCNVTVMGVEGDLVVCWKQNKLPIGSFEIKKPKADLRQKNDEVNGQVFDQMHTYRIGGPSQVFSVLTTWNEWQLQSTDSLESVKDVDLKELRNKYGGTASRAAPSPSEGQSDVSPEANFTFTEHTEVVIQPKNQDEVREKKRGAAVRGIAEGEQFWERKQFGSNIVSLDRQQGGERNQSEEVANLVATALLLMIKSTENWSKPRIANKPLHGPVGIIRLGEKTRAFAFSKGNLEEGINFDLPVGTQQKNFRIWFPLGRGAFATCCLATGAENGKCCVIKFYHEKDCLEAAKKERDHWKSINGKECSMVCAHKFQDGRCLLIMPYIHPIPAEERCELLGEDPRLGTALRKMAQTGLFYETRDIRWHHFGYRTSDKQEIRLCDFGKLVPIEQEMQVEELIKGALDQLRKRLQKADSSGIYESHLA